MHDPVLATTSVHATTSLSLLRPVSKPLGECGLKLRGRAFNPCGAVVTTQSVKRRSISIFSYITLHCKQGRIRTPKCRVPDRYSTFSIMFPTNSFRIALIILLSMMIISLLLLLLLITILISNIAFICPTDNQTEKCCLSTTQITLEILFYVLGAS